MDLLTLTLQHYVLVQPPDKFNVRQPQLLSQFISWKIISLPQDTSCQILPTRSLGLAPYVMPNAQFFTNQDVTVFSPTGKPILRGWWEKVMLKLWRFAFHPSTNDLPQPKPNTKHATLSAFSAYNLPRVESLVRYLHAAAGFPIKSTWLKSIKEDNCATWPGLTYSNADKYFPQTI